MTDILHDPYVRDLLTSLSSGEINLMTGLIWLAIATILSMIGGAIGGILLGGEDLGYELAGIMGGFLGPSGVIPAVLFGLVMLNIFGNF
ncbi:MAG: hypothetical protein ACHBN1_27875 [Heteroscytonema crispum UTEX LB 1556]